MESKSIGVLTGGGDCPGLNAAIRAVTKTAIVRGYRVFGFRDGLSGLMEEDYEELDMSKTSGIIDRGGTILGTTGIDPASIEDYAPEGARLFEKLNMKALIIIGGNTTLTIASRLYDKGLPIVGIPKTIDNDVVGTDFSIGFHTAVEIATNALDRLRSTAESHNRVMMLEVMGRDSGWIATYAGLANGADAILIPEIPVDVDNLCDMLVHRFGTGKRFSVVVVAEGARIGGASYKEGGKLGGVSRALEAMIQEHTGLESRTTLLGHVQRGGTPIAYDRILATTYGVKAIDLIDGGQFGHMAALQGSQVKAVPLAEAADVLKMVDLDVFRIAEIFFG